MTTQPTPPLTAAAIMGLMAWRYRAYPDDAVLGVGHWAEERGCRPTFCGAMWFTAGQLRAAIAGGVRADG